MSAASSIGDKATKLFALFCASATVVGVSALGVNVYFNTGRHRKSKPLPVDGEEVTSVDPSPTNGDTTLNDKTV